MKLVGIREIAELLGVSPQRVSALVARKDFPKPLDRLRMGPVWRLSDVERWRAARR